MFSVDPPAADRAADLLDFYVSHPDRSLLSLETQPERLMHLGFRVFRRSRIGGPTEIEVMASGFRSSSGSSDSAAR